MLTLIALLLAVVIALYLLYNKEKRSNTASTELYSDLHGVTDFNEIIKIISKKIERFGVEVVAFMGKTKSLTSLHDDGPEIKVNVLLTEPSAVAKSFFRLKPYSVGSECYDKVLEKEYGKNITIVPVFMKPEKECWQINDCKNNKCVCFKKAEPLCWLKSLKTHRGSDMGTYAEKMERCMCCKAFLPVGVFALRGKGVYRAYHFIIQNLPGIIRGSLKYEEARYLATHDGLTGLTNKVTFVEQLNMQFQMADRYHGELSLCMLDMDHFKSVNDQFGHPVGDAVLIDLAKILSKTITRKSDIIARYGGEEFTIIMPGTEKEKAKEIAEKIRMAVAEYEFPTVGNKTISIGIANMPDDNIEDPKDLISKADMALYAAKYGSKGDDGRNMVVLFKPEHKKLKEQLKKKEKKAEKAAAEKTAKDKVPGEVEAKIMKRPRKKKEVVKTEETPEAPLFAAAAAAQESSPAPESPAPEPPVMEPPAVESNETGDSGFTL